MRIIIVLTCLGFCACSSQPTELTQEPIDIHVFYEEPKIEYEGLGKVDTTTRARDAMDALQKVMRNAAELGADGVIVHSIGSRGEITGRADTFGTGGSEATEIFQIEATAIRYVVGKTGVEPQFPETR